MQIIKSVWKKFRELLAYGTNYIVHVAYWLAAVEVVVLFIWFVVNVDEIGRGDVISQTLDNGILRVHIFYPEYVGKGETGSFGISAENLGDATLKDVEIYLQDAEGNIVWFPDGNFVDFKSLKVDAGVFDSVNYRISDFAAENSKELSISVIVVYCVDDGKNIDSECQPALRKGFTDSYPVKYSEFKSFLLNFSKGFNQTSAGLSSLSDLMGFLVTISLSLISMRGNLSSLFNGQLSGNQNK